ncbi:MAG: hypothetical protein JRJ62_16575 [Deltaproteobacteria bacterium]|nr:hypothetical protein [Deltaproteobacteria bacterium]
MSVKGKIDTKTTLQAIELYMRRLGLLDNTTQTLNLGINIEKERKAKQAIGLARFGVKIAEPDTWSPAMRPTKKTPVAAQQVIRNRQYRYKTAGCEKFHKDREAEGVYMAEADDRAGGGVLTHLPVFPEKKIKKWLFGMQTFAHLCNIFVCFFVEKIKKIKKIIKGVGVVVQIFAHCLCMS